MAELQNRKLKEILNEIYHKSDSIRTSGNITNLWLFIIVIYLLFNRGIVYVYQDDYNATEPIVYCSKEGIEYFINGYTKVGNDNRYVLSVVYDTDRLPKKCSEPGR